MKCEEPGCNADQAPDYRFCKYCLEDKRFVDRWGQSKNEVDLKMALNRKDLEAITKQAMSKAVDDQYDAWQQQNRVLPTLVGDPDFAPGAGMVWNDKAARWERTITPYKPPESYRKILEAEFQGEGELVELDTAAEATIHMMKVLDDDWNGALDILYGGESLSDNGGDNGTKDKKSD